ncbi:MAG: L-threonylcarbamoyladenylate synthase [Chloroflexota bacterium]|nr:L-threonylcarbamoyladenylate synthase [Chloroflexota bacterium]
MTSQMNTRSIKSAIEVLRRGGVVAYPTDTLFGLGADALNEAAVERVFEIKGRPQGMPLPLLIGDPEQLKMVADIVTESAWKFATAFWPGGLTLVVPVGPNVPALVTARGWKVAVRLPDHPIPRELARGLGRPITGTSANRTGGPEPSTAELVQKQLHNTIDMILKGGAAPAGRSSTVIDITSDQPRVLRHGVVSVEQLERIYGGPVSVDETMEQQL